LGYSAEDLDRFNRKSISILEEVRDEYEAAGSLTPFVISGNLGQRGNEYTSEVTMTYDDARKYHRPQIETFADTAADMVSFFTIPSISEALGGTLAAKDLDLPVVMSFTLETDGRLPSGESLKDAIEFIDQATDCYPAYYMINCAHPSHFDKTITKDAWIQRIKGVRANASEKSHAELDESAILESGDHNGFGSVHEGLIQRLPNLNIFGGCCGTDHRHVENIYWTVVAS
jgi:S-methylmethionine-dependent homocysteine/selenocysteine methylase